MKVLTITPIEVAGKEYAAGIECDIPEDAARKLVARGAVRIEIDFKQPEVVETRRAVDLPPAEEAPAVFIRNKRKR